MPVDHGKVHAKPFAITDRIRNAQRLTAVDRVAGSLGIKPGETLSDARSRVPNLEIYPANPDADRALLVGIADWCDRYTPLLALDGPDSLMLDISGCAHLFGGESEMIEDIVRRLRKQGFSTRAAIADTSGAAWAVTRFGDGGVVARGGQKKAIEGLPLASLGLNHDSIEELARIGLKRIDDIINRPRAPLISRFGPDLIRKLDLALGNEKVGISPRMVTPACVAERRFAEPIAYEKDVRSTILSLAMTLSARLESRGEGARALELTFFRADGAVTRLMVGTSRPVRDPDHVLGLFSEKLNTLGDELDAGFGFDLIRLGAIEVQILSSIQIDLAGEISTEEELACLVDRLSARLGMARVARFLPHETHLPERRTTEAPATLTKESELLWSGESKPGIDQPLERPVRLFENPEPVETIATVPEGPPLRFRWRKVLHEIARAEGPERITPEWWRDGAEVPTRDYYRVEDRAGLRFWLFREGLYGREVKHPRWYMHGIFP